MNSTCTCGAAIPDGAEFCPLCGRPLSEEARQAEAERDKAAIELSRRRAAGEEPQSRPIGFGNPVALRSSYLAGLLAAFLSSLPLLNFLCFVWYPATGFLSVYLYRRRTGESPTPREGARLGAMTGVLTSVISLVIGALNSLVSEGDFADVFRRQIKQMAVQEELQRDMLEQIENPTAVALIVLTILAMTLIATLGFSTAGGALGAKVLEDDRPPSSQ
ncbi:MAG: zinc ribbon domain-containing protein [Acidobacteria bacterium]|nr:zinc ribbon domain-containing protein [Acidobacteriota bacterium]